MNTFSDLLEDKTAYTDVEAIQKVKDMYAGCIDIGKLINWASEIQN